MKSKASLVLMEQLIMVLVFGLAAAVCLGAFLRADQISKETAARDRAVVMAQNGAEVVKSCAGDLDQAVRLLNGEKDGSRITVQEGAYTLEIERLETQIPGLGVADIRVKMGDAVLFSLQTGWQEVAQ